MPTQDTDLIPAAHRFGLAVAATAIVIGATVLVGWTAEVPVMRSLGPGLATMKANTALCTALSGLALLLACLSTLPGMRGRPASAARLVARLVAAATLVFAAATLAQDVFGTGFGIDEFLFRDYASAATGSPAPGRMSQATSVGFILISSSALASLSSAKHLAGIGQGFAVAGAFLGFIAVLGYLVYIPALYGVTVFSTVAVHTGTLLFLLALAWLVARPADGWVRVWFVDTASARMGLQMVAATVVALPIFGWLSWAGQLRGLFHFAFGYIVLVVAGIAAMSPIIWLATHRANREEEQVRRLARIYQVLSGINALIVRTHDRNQLLSETCRIAVENGHFPFVWAGMVDPVRQAVVPIAWAGEEQGFLDHVADGLSLHSEADPTRPVPRAVFTVAPVICDDIREEPGYRYRDELLERGTRSFAILPMVKESRCVGVIAVHSRIPHFFDDAELRLLKELAGDVAFAYDHIEKEERLNHLAYFNTLTNLANRTLFLDRVGQHVRGAARTGGRLALVLFDVAGFKAVNDAFGRSSGDELLRELGARLEHHGDEPSYFARIEADRFATVMPKVLDEHEVVRACEDIIRACFDPPLTIDGHELRLSVRTGVALYPRDGSDPDDLFHNAEAALKVAKSSGDRLLFYAPQINADLAARLRLESGLRRALERGEFVLHYQPKVDTVTREVHGLEALIRWQSPELGLVSPGEFIPLLEETGLIVEVGTWVLRQAIADRRRCRERIGVSPRIAVNVSAVQLRRPDFLTTVVAALEEDTDPPGVDLEITESVLMRDIGPAIEKLDAIAERGVGIAIDDFGTGYSSLAYLAKLPARTLKIDHSFVNAFLREGHVATLISSVILMAHALGMRVIAEGVETDEQARGLQALGCDELQGFLVSRPVPLEELLAFMEASGNGAAVSSPS